MNRIADLSHSHLQARMYYWQLLLDPSLALLILLAAGLIHYSNTLTRPRTQYENEKALKKDQPADQTPPEEEQVADPIFKSWKIIIPPILGSIVLVALFFFFNILKYLLIVICCLSGISSTSVFCYSYWNQIVYFSIHRSRWSQIRLPFKIANCIGSNNLPSAVVLSIITGLIVVISWLVMSILQLEGTWILVDVMAMCLLAVALSGIQIPGGNVMETVAVGAAGMDLPLVLKIPKVIPYLPLIDANSVYRFVSPHPLLKIADTFEFQLGTAYSSSFIMLGLGDVLIPGATLALMYRISHAYDDFYCKFEIAPYSWVTYYRVGLTGYSIGLAATFLSLVLMDRSQPALIYLVPFTLIPIYLLAWKRGQLKQLWQSDWNQSIGAAGTTEYEYVMSLKPELANISNGTDQVSLMDTPQLSNEPVQETP